MKQTTQNPIVQAWQATPVSKHALRNNRKGCNHSVRLHVRRIVVVEVFLQNHCGSSLVLSLQSAVPVPFPSVRKAVHRDLRCIRFIVENDGKRDLRVGFEGVNEQLDVLALQRLLVIQKQWKAHDLRFTPTNHIYHRKSTVFLQDFYQWILRTLQTTYGIKGGECRNSLSDSV